MYSDHCIVKWVIFLCTFFVVDVVVDVDAVVGVDDVLKHLKGKLNRSLSAVS